jgi:hypothetical protein
MQAQTHPMQNSLQFINDWNESLAEALYLILVFSHLAMVIVSDCLQGYATASTCGMGHSLFCQIMVLALHTCLMDTIRT